MSCNTCAKSFSVFRKEKGCPGCGFSYCSNCLNNLCFVPKISKQTKVCVKCKMSDQKPAAVEPPSAYFKRLQSMENAPKPPIVMYQSDSKTRNLKRGLSKEDQKIIDRLTKLNEGGETSTSSLTDKQIEERLKRLRGHSEERVSVTDTEMAERLANLKGECFIPPAKSSIPSIDLRTDEEKTQELMLKYMEECRIDESKDRAFQETVNKMEQRLNKLQDRNELPAASGAEVKDMQITNSSMSVDDEVQKIIKQCISEPMIKDDDEGISEAALANTAEELPWCEICNEDADFRCLGCRDLFCKDCFREHLDEDLGCIKGEPYKKKQIK